MKSNKLAIRICFIILILTMISVCTLSGTLAMYITTDAGYDIAYVAQWGVEVAVTGQTYEYDGIIYEESLMYTSNDAASMTSIISTVAPNSSGYYTFGWSGTPEVDVLITAGDYAELDSTESVIRDTDVGAEMMQDSSSSLLSASLTGTTYSQISGLESDTTSSSTYYSQYGGSWYGADGYAYYPIEWGLFELTDSTIVDDLFDDSYFYSEYNLVGDYNSSALCNVDIYTDDSIQTNYATDYSSFLATVNSIYFLYEAYSNIDNRFVVVWKWDANQYDAVASANDTYLGDLAQYVDYYMVTNVYEVGDIIPSIGCNAATEAGCSVSHLSGYYIVTSTNKYSSYSVGDIITNEEYDDCYYSGCLLDDAYKVTSVQTMASTLQETPSVGDIIEVYESGAGYSAVLIESPYIEVAITVTVQQYINNIRDTDMS